MSLVVIWRVVSVCWSAVAGVGVCRNLLFFLVTGVCVTPVYVRFLSVLHTLLCCGSLCLVGSHVCLPFVWLLTSVVDFQECR